MWPGRGKASLSGATQTWRQQFDSGGQPIMKIRVITISEDAVSRPGLLGEQGLSVFIEANGQGILFDTGQSISALHNARRLGVSIAAIGTVVLSHSHSDHTGGLRDVLRETEAEVSVVAHPDVFTDRFVRFPSLKAAQGVFPGVSGRDMNAGMPYSQRELESWGAQFSLVSEPVQIVPGIITTGEVPRQVDFESDASHDVQRLIWNGRSYIDDEILDDLGMILTTTEGLVVILGCAHRGIVNSLYHAQKLTGEQRIHAVLGGSHLVQASEERIERTMDALAALDISLLGLCHCTGYSVQARLADRFGDKFFQNHAGTCIEFPDLVA
jgi:7,8-dihydropterin-6-yl-methyl-4-(beta-D-ribofuranosyl)aminobenzene 5'-phosphate synthase